ncbi:hypothetical protein LTR15_010376 [Elasticomyces elasticus]|nr:hypothetical protein LTR15_010376 [Elasticomyces elasticus]
MAPTSTSHTESNTASLPEQCVLSDTTHPTVTPNAVPTITPKNTVTHDEAKTSTPHHPAVSPQSSAPVASKFRIMFKHWHTNVGSGLIVAKGSDVAEFFNRLDVKVRPDLRKRGSVVHTVYVNGIPGMNGIEIYRDSLSEGDEWTTLQQCLEGRPNDDKKVMEDVHLVALVTDPKAL